MISPAPRGVVDLIGAAAALVSSHTVSVGSTSIINFSCFRSCVEKAVSAVRFPRTGDPGRRTLKVSFMLAPVMEETDSEGGRDIQGVGRWREGSGERKLKSQRCPVVEEGRCRGDDDAARCLRRWLPHRPTSSIPECFQGWNWEYLHERMSEWLFGSSPPI